MKTIIDLLEATSAPAQVSAYGPAAARRRGFFTDTTLCIGCKACEVACKEWNQLPQDGYTFTGMSYDNTGELSGTSWRHVAFIEQFENGKNRWLMESDVCKHCTHAGCLDVCPTGAIVRSEFGTVVIQDDVCNGCGYCVVACPFGVIGQRVESEPHSGKTHGKGTMGKCTLCYDRLKDGDEPACAKACPTTSIAYGDVDDLRERAQRRLEDVRGRFDGARLYLEDGNDGIGGGGSIFLLLDRPEVYGLPPNPFVPTKHLPEMWRAAVTAAAALAATVCLAGWWRR